MDGSDIKTSILDGQCTVYEGLCICGVARQFCIHNVTFSEGKYNTIHKLEM